MIVGTPKTVRAQNLKLAEAIQADEVMLAMIAFDFRDKLRSYELIAKEMLTKISSTLTYAGLGQKMSKRKRKPVIYRRAFPLLLYQTRT